MTYGRFNNKYLNKLCIRQTVISNIAFLIFQETHNFDFQDQICPKRVFTV